MADEPSFRIPARPQRRFDRAGRLSYEGKTVFRLEPAADEEIDLAGLLDGVLASGPYRYGDFLELPMTVYLVRDDETGDVFRVSIRDGTLGLHVLPATERAGLERFYERLCERSGQSWRVSREVTS